MIFIQSRICNGYDLPRSIEVGCEIGTHRIDFHVILGLVVFKDHLWFKSQPHHRGLTSNVEDAVCCEGSTILPLVKMFYIVQGSLCHQRQVLLNGVALCICNVDGIELLIAPPTFESYFFTLQYFRSTFKQQCIQHRIIKEHSERHIPLGNDTWNSLRILERSQGSLNNQP